MSTGRKNKSDEISVFISFQHQNKEFVDCLANRLEKEARVLRYEDGVGPWGSITKFMDSIAEQDFAVLVISDSYLKSYACMYEVLQATKTQNWQEHVLFALMPDAKPYQDDNKVAYITYWEKQYSDLKNKLASIPTGSSPDLDEKLMKIDEIRGSIGSFLAVLSDTNCPPYYAVISEICDRVHISRKSRFVAETQNGQRFTMNGRYLFDLITEYPRISVKEMSDYSGISEGSVRYAIQGLENFGLVKVGKDGKSNVYTAA